MYRFATGLLGILCDCRRKAFIDELVRVLASIVCRQGAVVFAILGFMVITPAALHAGPIFYTGTSVYSAADLSGTAAFDAAEPGLPVEIFSPNLSGQMYLTQSSPLSAATNDSVFPTGSILPGITISNLNSANTPGLLVYGDGVAPYYFEDSLVLTLAPSVTAIGERIYARSSAQGPTVAGTFTEDVYNGTTLIGSTNLSENQGDAGFIGVSSTTPITSIEITFNSDVDGSPVVNDIAFGSPVPEPSSLAFLSAFGFLILFGCRSKAARRSWKRTFEETEGLTLPLPK
jgi:hypothetical protein